MILDNSSCPCGHEVVDGDCVVWDQHGVEHRVPNSGLGSNRCRCHVGVGAGAGTTRMVGESLMSSIRRDDLAMLWWSRNDFRKAVRSAWPELGQLLDDTTKPYRDPHAEARGPRPVDVGDRVAWTEDQLAYVANTGGFEPTGVTLHFTGEVRRVEVDLKWPDEWTAYVCDDNGKPHGLNAARLERVLV